MSWFEYGPYGEHPDDRSPGLATPGEAHSEWHRNAGVPMGTPGCPQDACHEDYDECEHGESYPDCAPCQAAAETARLARQTEAATRPPSPEPPF